MASGDQSTDETDDGSQRMVQRVRFRDEATYFLQNFIVERFQEEQLRNTPSLRELRDMECYDGDEEELESSWRTVGKSVKKIAVSVDQSIDFQRVVNSVPKDPSIEDVMGYIRNAFTDGKINWGRIVALFCFAYQVCARKFEHYMENRYPNFPSWLTKLITAIIKFLLVKFADWVINRGGWQSIQEYFGTKQIVFNTLLVVSVVLSVGVTLLHLKR